MLQPICFNVFAPPPSSPALPLLPFTLPFLFLPLPLTFPSLHPSPSASPLTSPAVNSNTASLKLRLVSIHHCFAVAAVSYWRRHTAAAASAVALAVAATNRKVNVPATQLHSCTCTHTAACRRKVMQDALTRRQIHMLNPLPTCL